MNFTYKKGIYNTYTPGSGVGSTSIAVRRSKLRYAASCSCRQSVKAKVELQYPSNQQTTSNPINNI